MLQITELSQPISADYVERISNGFELAFGRAPSPDFEERLHEKRNLLVLVAGEGSVDGFKIGHERFRSVFFSWLGAVKPQCQRQGIARSLLQRQHALCIERGYREIQTETFADNTGMLLLNLQEGFEINGTVLGNDNRLRVQLRKRV